jgi:hypothetical protein
MNKKFTYEYLEIKNTTQILVELKNFYQNNKINYNEQFNGIRLAKLIAGCPSFLSWLIENKLRPTYAYYVLVKSKQTTPLHIDAQENDLSINFPIENCDNTWTTMYEVDSPLVYKVIYPGGVKRHWWEWEDSDPKKTEICRCYVTGPLIFNTKIPHQVNNPTDTDRVSFICRFQQDPWFLIKHDR